MAERPMIAVVETGKLGRDDPDRRGENEQQCAGGAAPPEPDEDGGHGNRQEVSQREHPAEERLRVVPRREAIDDNALLGAPTRGSSSGLELAQLSSFVRATLGLYSRD